MCILRGLRTAACFWHDVSQQHHHAAHSAHSHESQILCHRLRAADAVFRAQRHHVGRGAFCPSGRHAVWAWADSLLAPPGPKAKIQVEHLGRGTPKESFGAAVPGQRAFWFVKANDIKRNYEILSIIKLLLADTQY